MLSFIEEFFGPIVFPLLVVGFLYFTFEVVGPYADELSAERKKCENANGAYSARDRACFMKVKI